jgi:hypothetical protein
MLDFDAVFEGEPTIEAASRYSAMDVFGFLVALSSLQGHHVVFDDDFEFFRREACQRQGS